MYIYSSDGQAYRPVTIVRGSRAAIKCSTSCEIFIHSGISFVSENIVDKIVASIKIDDAFCTDYNGWL